VQSRVNPPVDRWSFPTTTSITESSTTCSPLRHLCPLFFGRIDTSDSSIYFYIKRTAEFIPQAHIWSCLPSALKGQQPVTDVKNLTFSGNNKCCHCGNLFLQVWHRLLKSIIMQKWTYLDIKFPLGPQHSGGASVHRPSRVCRIARIGNKME